MKKPTTKRIKKATKPEINGSYTAKLRCLGKDYTSIGENLKEAIAGISYTGKIGGLVVLTVTHGDTKRERVLNSVIANRLFTRSTVMRELAIKNMVTLFDNL